MSRKSELVTVTLAAVIVRGVFIRFEEISSLFMVEFPFATKLFVQVMFPARIMFASSDALADIVRL